MLALPTASAEAVGGDPTVAVFVDGQAQIVEGFADPQSWIRQDL